MSSCEGEHECGCHDELSCGRILTSRVLQAAVRRHGRERSEWSDLVKILRGQADMQDQVFTELLSACAVADVDPGATVKVVDIYRILSKVRRA